MSIACNMYRDINYGPGWKKNKKDRKFPINRRTLFLVENLVWLALMICVHSILVWSINPPTPPHIHTRSRTSIPIHSYTSERRIQQLFLFRSGSMKFIVPEKYFPMGSCYNVVLRWCGSWISHPFKDILFCGSGNIWFLIQTTMIF